MEHIASYTECLNRMMYVRKVDGFVFKYENLIILCLASVNY